MVLVFTVDGLRLMIKQLLQDKAEGHGRLAEVLLSREVIFTEDVEKIFGKRQWTSRTDEILHAAHLGAFVAVGLGEAIALACGVVVAEVG